MRRTAALNGPTIALVAISTLMLQLTLYDRQGHVASEWLQLGVALALAAAVYALGSRQQSLTARSALGLCLGALIMLPFFWNVGQRSVVYTGQPFEMQLALSLQNMMIALLVHRGSQHRIKFAALASCFLMLFSTLWILNRWTGTLLFLYTLVGMWWLMGAYWDRLSGSFLSDSERVIPWKPIALVALACGGAFLLALPFATGENFTTAIQGFLPSSGGTLWSDEHAYGGVGDGPQMVAGKDDASSFGPVETDLFIESKMPSLYDSFNEFSDAPPRRPSDRRVRSIPLAPSQMKTNHQEKGNNQKAGREFNAVRQRKRKTPKVSDLRSHALVQVVGRVPVHLGLYTYDMWDGHLLSSSNPGSDRTLFLDTSSDEGRNWARFIGVTDDTLLDFRDRHELRIVNLKTDRVPTPPNSIGVHIDKLHTETMFDETQDGMLALDVDFIPQLSVLHVESLQRQASRIPQLTSTEAAPVDASPKIAALAREWTIGVEGDWPKVQAICNRLREEYVLDAEHSAPVACEDAAEYFLFESRRGPDYLFATSAALLVRSLGYESRVVSGFYADPKHYDPVSRLTSVYKDDAHLWIEVLAKAPNARYANVSPTLHWLALDPSPGYQVLLAPDSFWSLLMARTARAWQIVKRNPVPAIVSLALCCLTWMWRASIGDLLVTAWWEIRHRTGDVRQRVIATLQLLDRRAYVRGCTRANAVPLGQWEFASSSNCESESWPTAFRDLANWALYGQGTPLSCSPEQADALCRRAAGASFRSRGTKHGVDRSDQQEEV